MEKIYELLKFECTTHIHQQLKKILKKYTAMIMKLSEELKMALTLNSCRWLNALFNREELALR